MTKPLKDAEIQAYIEAKALAALAYAKESIKKGSTQIENNDLGYDKIIALEKAMSDERKLYADNLLVILEDVIVHFYENQMNLTDKYSFGNCCELTNKALDYFVTQDEDKVRAERYKIVNGDHVFLVINRPLESNPADPTTWGKNAYICDPLLNKVFPATEYLTELKAYQVTHVVNDKMKIKQNSLIAFNPSYHKLEQVPFYNTDYLLFTRSTQHLKATFLEKTKGLMSLLNNYKFKLLWIKGLSAFDNTDTNLEKKISDVKSCIGKIKTIIDQVNKMDCNKYSYRQMRIDLHTSLKEIIKSFIESTELNQVTEKTDSTDASAVKLFKLASKIDQRIRAAKNDLTMSLNYTLNKPIKAA